MTTLVVAGIVGPTVFAGVSALLLVLAGSCSHEMFPKVDLDTGRIFQTCRCGKRFQR